MTSPVGRSVTVIDAPARVSGTIDYILDLELPRMLFGRILRSPHPHARILSIDTSPAERLPGVLAVVTGERLRRGGLAERKYGRFFLDQDVLSSERVRFAGEPVAAVAATSEELALEACARIEVEYEPLPAVFSIEDALKPDAPLLHEPRPKLRQDVRNMIAAPSEVSNLCSYFRLRSGSVEQGFAQSDYLISNTFQSPAVQHVPLEPHVSLASYGDQLTIWTSTQMPHAIRAQMAELVGLPLSRVRVITANVGGGFGSKGSLRLEPIASVLSRAARRPVKIALERDEEFVTVTKHAASIEIKSGVTKDGYLVAREITAYFNTGAYADVGPMVARNAGCAIAGPYRIPHVAVDSHCVWTNLVPAGAFRGFGVAQGAWAYESHTDIIAERIGMDPVLFRRQNLLRAGDRYATGERVDDVHFDRLLDHVADAIDWRPQPLELHDPPSQEAEDDPGLRRRGRAITTMMKATITPSTSTAGLKLNEDGSLDVLTSSVDLGQGAKTVLAQIAAEGLDLPLDVVHVASPDTELTPYDQQTSSSRTTYSMGNAVSLAAQDVRQQLLEIAAVQLEASTEDLEMSDGSVRVRGTATRSLGYGELLRAARVGNLQGVGTLKTEGEVDPETGQGIASVHWHHGAAGCEVEVDLETGKIEVLRLAAAVFAGRVINPRLCELQVEGSVMFGLGQALFEEIDYEEGVITNANLSDYMIPSFEDIPNRIDVFLVENGGGGDIHGVGETALPPISPAIANAVYNAVNARITELPITPEKLLRSRAAHVAQDGTVERGQPATQR